MVASTIKDAIKSAVRNDSWANAITGIGGIKDKLTHLLVKYRDKTFDEDSLEQLYCSDDLAARLVDVIPDEMLRQGYIVQIGEENEAEDQVNDLIESCKVLGLDSALVKAMKWARLYGAGAIIVGAEDGLDPKEPLDELNIQRVKFLNVVDLRDLTIMDWYSDPYAPKFGKPKIFQVTHSGPRASGTSYIHESRIVLFEGRETPWRKKTGNRGFSFSVLELTADTLKEFHTTWKSAAHLMTDMSQGVVSIDGLMAMIGGGQKDLLMDRIEIMNMSRSVSRLMLLDADKEKFERHATPIQGVADILQMSMIRMSGASETPVSILFGQDPAGLNSTGDMQVRRFYDMISSRQENDLRPEHTRILRLIMLAKDGPTGGEEPDNWTLTYRSLWQMTDKEKAELRLSTVQADAIEIDSGTLLVDEVALSRHTLGGFNAGDIQIDRDLRKKNLEAEKLNMGSDDGIDPNPQP